MAKQIINAGARSNDGTGDSLRDGARKINENFSEIYSLLGDGETLSVVSRISVGQGLAVSNPTGAVLITGRIASSNDLGMIKVGANLTVAPDGTLNAVQTEYQLPTASNTVLGGVKVGTGLSINQGVLSANNPTPYSLPIASNSTLGGIKIGANLSVAPDGTVSGTASYNLPTATDTVLGGIKIGAGLSISQGVVSVTNTTNSSDRLVNGSQELILDGDGILTFPGGSTFGDNILTGSVGSDLAIVTDDGEISNQWTFRQTGPLVAPGGAIISSETQTIINPFITYNLSSPSRVNKIYWKSDGGQPALRSLYLGVATDTADPLFVVAMELRNEIQAFGMVNGRIIRFTTSSGTTHSITIPQYSNISAQLSITELGGEPGIFWLIQEGIWDSNGAPTEDTVIDIVSLSYSALDTTYRDFAIELPSPNGEDEYRWEFANNGNLQLPVGGDIVDSIGNSVLGSGSIAVGNGQGPSVENVTEILINGTITEIEPGLVGISVSSGLVERTVNFPTGATGDTRGTIALTPGGTTYICTEDWTDATTGFQGTFTATTTELYNISQSGGSFNSAVLSIVDEPELYNIIRYGIWAEGQLTVDAGVAYGGAQNVVNTGWDDQAGTMSFLWLHRAEDPSELAQGSSVIFVYTGSGTQPPIWKQLVNLASNGYGDGEINWVNEGDLTVSTTRPTGYTGDCDLNLYAADDVWIEAAGDDVVITAANEVRIESNSVNTNYTWTFSADGGMIFPTLTVPISDNATPSGTGQTIKFSEPAQQAIIYGPASTVDFVNAERVIIQGAPGFAGTSGEGGDVYLWAGPGGDGGGDGGDIKIRAGRGQLAGAGGYLNFQAGQSNTGNGGWINIESGYSNTYGSGGNITVQARSGGQVILRTTDSIGNARDLVLDNAGATTFPGAVVKSTIDKTGIDIGVGTATGLVDSTWPDPIVDGNYGPFTLGVVTFTVVVTSGVAAYTVVSTTGTSIVGQIIGNLNVSDLGGTPGNSSPIIVTSVNQAFTALDLTKSVNKLTNGQFTLANGVEGQIMYLVPQSGITPNSVDVTVANYRIDGTTGTNGILFPFRIFNGANASYFDSGAFCTLIFTDGAWQQSGGSWD